jgi:hypothetical protein
METEKRKRWLTAGLILLWALVVLVWHLAGGGLHDTARLQLHYAGQLAAGESLRINPEDPSSDAAADPLQVFPLALGRLLGGKAGARWSLHLLNALLLLGWLLVLRRLARLLGAEERVSAIAVAAALVCAPLVGSVLGGDPQALPALLLAWAVCGILERRIAVVVPPVILLTLTTYAGMFAALAICAAVPAVDSLKGERLSPRLFWLLIPCALAVVRALLARTAWGAPPLEDVLTPLADAPGGRAVERLGLVLALPHSLVRDLGGSVIGMITVALAVGFAVPRMRWRLSAAMLVIALALGGLVMRGDGLILLWLSPLVVTAVVIWSAQRMGGRRRRLIAGAAATLMVVPGLFAFESDAVPEGAVDFQRRAADLLPERSCVATLHPGLYLQHGGLRVADLSGALPPRISEYPRVIATVLEDRAMDPRFRRPGYLVSEPGIHEEIAANPLAALVLEDGDGERGLWRLDWVPLERRFGLWTPSVIEALQGRRLLEFIELGGDSDALQQVAFDTLAGVRPRWELIVHDQVIAGRRAEVADTCLVFENADALRLELALPQETTLVCLRFCYRNTPELEVRSETQGGSEFHEVEPQRWNELMVRIIPGQPLVIITFKGLESDSSLALGSLWYFK